MPSISGIINTPMISIPSRPKRKMGKQALLLSQSELINSDTIKLNGRLGNVPKEILNKIIDKLPLLSIAALAQLNKNWRTYAYEILGSEKRQDEIAIRIKAKAHFNSGLWKYPKKQNWEPNFDLFIKESLGLPESPLLSDRQIQSIAERIASFSSSECPTDMYNSTYSRAGNRDRAISIIALNCALAVFNHKQQELMFGNPQTILKFLSVIGKDSVQNPESGLNPRRYMIKEAIAEQKPYISPLILNDFENATYFDINYVLDGRAHKRPRELRLADRRAELASTAETPRKHPNYRYDADWYKNRAIYGNLVPKKHSAYLKLTKILHSKTKSEN